MKDYDPEKFGERIRKEMGRAGIKEIRALRQKLVDETNERGTSYTAVFQYVKGTWPTEPRRPVVEALARVLNGVRPEYLLFDEGGRTEAEEEVRRSQPPHAAQNFWSRVHDEIPELSQLDLSVSGNLIGVTLRCHAFRAMGGRTGDGDELLPLAEEWWRVVTESAAAAEEILGAPIRQDVDAFSDFANGVLHALSGLIHSMEPRARRSPLELLAGASQSRAEQEADDDEA
jgi:hypothetical protein